MSDYKTEVNKDLQFLPVTESELRISDIEMQRRQLWIDVAVAIAGSPCDDLLLGAPGKYADAALEAFDQRFGVPTQNK